MLMIPVTAFAGRKVAVFGLARSGLLAARALVAGGADVVAWDDNADAPRRGAAPAFRSPTCATPTGRVAALVLSPGVPLTHPAPHWTVGLARAAAVEVIGDIELFCRERRAPRARRARSSPSPAPTASRPRPP